MTGSTGWRVLASSVRGASHRASGRPNQDAWAGSPADSACAETGFVALADGHGGSVYYRSDQGSSFAVDTARLLSEEVLAGGSAGLDEPAWRGLVERLVDQWTARVLAHAQQHPPTAEEQARVPDAFHAGVDPMTAYGSTVLWALATRDALLLAQIGDGDLIVVGPDGTASRPLPDDPLLVANQTTSLCLPDAARYARLVSVDLAEQPVELLIASTDGYANSFAADNWAGAVAADVLAELRSGGWQGVLGELPGWLTASAEMGGDDVTVALFLHESAC